MSTVRSAPVAPDTRAGLAILGDHDRAALQRLVDDDPYVNAVLASRLRSLGSLHPARIGGELLGRRDGAHLRAAAFHGGNLLPVGGTSEDWTAVARRIAQSPHRCTSIVGRADAVLTMWQVLSRHWNRPRGIRPDQRLLVAEQTPAVPVDPRVRLIEPHELDAYLPASIAMFTEELGVSPAAGSGLAAYRRRIEWLITSRRAFGIVGGDGRVAFKTDLGAVSERTCQLQGVWVRPDLRGTGLGTAALAAVIASALRIAPTVSLYVNDHNVAARRLYARLGMREVARLATVLL